MRKRFVSNAGSIPEANISVARVVRVGRTLGPYACLDAR